MGTAMSNDDPQGRSQAPEPDKKDGQVAVALHPAPVAYQVAGMFFKATAPIPKELESLKVPLYAAPQVHPAQTAPRQLHEWAALQESDGSPWSEGYDAARRYVAMQLQPNADPATPAKIDVQGRLIGDQIELIGEATHVEGNLYRCLANVSGNLCLVEVRAKETQQPNAQMREVQAQAFNAGRDFEHERQAALHAQALAPRDALTDEQVASIYRQTYPQTWMANGSLVEFARAIERAHGIGAASSGGASAAAKSSEQRLKSATQTSEQDRPKGIPPPKMTIAGEGPDRGHWWSEDQVRAIVSGETRSGASDGSDVPARSDE